MAENIIEKVIESAANLTDKVEEIKEDLWGEEQKLIIEEFKDSSISKVKDLLNNINGSSALIDKSGFHLESLNITMGLPPDISGEFRFVSKISPEEKEKLIEEVKDNKVVKIITNCLFKASEFYDKIQFGNYKLDIVEITLGITPGIVMKFKNN